MHGILLLTDTGLSCCAASGNLGQGKHSARSTLTCTELLRCIRRVFTEAQDEESHWKLKLLLDGPKINPSLHELLLSKHKPWDKNKAGYCMIRTYTCQSSGSTPNQSM